MTTPDERYQQLRDELAFCLSVGLDIDHLGGGTLTPEQQFQQVTAHALALIAHELHLLRTEGIHPNRKRDKRNWRGEELP